MSPSLTVDALLERNALRSFNHKPIPLLSEISKLPADQQIPMPKIYIVSCCDPRVNVWEILGLQEWDAVVARSAAGRITPQLQNLVFLDHVLQFSEVMILHHTDCSAEIFDNEEVRENLRLLAPDSNEKIESLVLPGFKNLQESVRGDVQIVKSSPLIRPALASKTRGFVFDLKSGKVAGVEPCIRKAGQGQAKHAAQYHSEIDIQKDNVPRDT